MRAGLDTSVSLPGRVLDARYESIFVMEFDRLIHSCTVDMLKALIRWEGSALVALAKLKEIGSEPQDGQNDFFFVNLATATDTYEVFIKRNVRKFAQQRETAALTAPWLIFAETIGACSDLGSWCIYGEKFAEIAIVGFKQSPDLFFEKRLNSDFGIEKLADALKRDTFFGDAGNEFSKEQRSKLRAAYLSRIE
jgi:hypothetical protein